MMSDLGISNVRRGPPVSAFPPTHSLFYPYVQVVSALETFIMKFGPYIKELAIPMAHKLVRTALDGLSSVVSPKG